MIVVTRDNILRTKIAVEAIINPVNCVGVMGKGLALQFKNEYPDNYEAYRVECNIGRMVVGRCFVFQRSVINNPKYIVNFPTKSEWHDNSNLEYIRLGLIDLVNCIKKYNISSIAIPALGCGLGQLNWKDVKQLIEETFIKLEDIDVILFEPF